MIRRLGVLAVVLATFLVTGCVSVPTDEAVRPVQVGPQQPVAQNVFTADPPRVGATRRDIVEEFLTSFAQGNDQQHEARMFLTRSQAESWAPDGSVQILSGVDAPVVAPDGSAYDYSLVGQLSKGGAYSSNATSVTSRWQPELVQEKIDGHEEWRISSPPNSMLVPAAEFGSLFHHYDLYYFDSTFSVLVPYPIFLRYRGDDTLRPQALLSRLRSPDPTFVTAENRVVLTTTPQVVVHSDGVADVKVADSRQIPADERDRQRFAAQIVYTLSQLSAVKSIRINGGGYDVPGASSGSVVKTIGPDAFPGYAPLQAGTEPQLYGLTGADGLVTIGEGSGGQPQARRLPGSPEVPAGRLSSIAVSARQDRIAAVSAARTEMTVSPLPAGPALATVRGTDLLPPQFTRFGEVWTVSTVDAVSTVRVVDDHGSPLDLVNSSDLGGGEVTAFRISPDGTRIVVVRKLRNTYTLSIGFIDRSDPTRLELAGITPLPVAPNLTSKSPVVTDVAWSGPTELLVLADNAPYTLAVDGSDDASFGRAALWQVSRITAPTLADAALPPSVAFGVGGRSWYLRNGSWTPFLDGLTFATYSG